MLRRILILAAPLALIAAQAQASGKKAEKGDDKSPAGQYVDISTVALPIIVEGRLVNYVFAAVRLNLATGANSVKLREKEPVFRDALVRAAHRTPFTLTTDYSRVDEAKLSTAMLRETAVIAGRGAVKSVVVTRQSPKSYVPTPKTVRKP